MRRESTSNFNLTLLVRLLVGLIFVYIVWSLSKNLIELTKMDERLIIAQDEVDILLQENQQLQAKAVEVGTPSHEEGLIRDQLGLVQPNETLVIIPDESLHLSTQSGLSRENITPSLAKTPIWQQWVRLFL